MSNDNTTDRILNAAGQVFAAKGFQAATVREICQLAEVNLAAINYHFGDKERLYAQAIKHAHEFRTRQAPLPNWPPGTPAEVRLRDFVRTTLVRMIGVKAMPWQAELMMREVLHPSPAARALVEEYFRPHFDQLQHILAELLPEETPPHRRVQWAFSVIGQCLFYRFNMPIVRMLIPEEDLLSYYGAESLAEHISDVMLAALQGRGKLGHSTDGPAAFSNRGGSAAHNPPSDTGAK